MTTIYANVVCATSIVHEYVVERVTDCFSRYLTKRTTEKLKEKVITANDVTCAKRHTTLKSIC